MQGIEDVRATTIAWHFARVRRVARVRVDCSPGAGAACNIRTRIILDAIVICGVTTGAWWCNGVRLVV